jgi:hypothetical protein
MLRCRLPFTLVRGDEMADRLGIGKRLGMRDAVLDVTRQMVTYDLSHIF